MAGWWKCRKEYHRKHWTRRHRKPAIATEQRKREKKETQKDVCVAQLGEMLHGKHPEIETLLIGAIEPMQERKFAKITINTGFNKTVRMTMTKDGIKIEIERKMKEENLA